MSERLFTLEDAELELTRRECVWHGHSFDVITAVSHNGPFAVICSRCGETWGIQKDDEAAPTLGGEAA